MKAIFCLLVCTFCTAVSIQAQNSSVQWTKLILSTDKLHFLQSDSAKQVNSLYTFRQILYDSLSGVSARTGKPFSENIYTASLSTAAQTCHIILSFPEATRLIYYIKLYDTKDQSHLVYEYGAVKPCDAEKTTMLTIARTPYKVSRVEVGTFIQNQELTEVGVSAEPDGNLVIRDVLASKHLDICSKTSYLADKEKLSATINTSGNEVKPIIAPDGKTLIFHRQNHESNTGRKKDDQDIFMVRQLAAGQWSEASNPGKPLNDKLANGVAAVSPGATTLYLISEYMPNGDQKQGLSYTDKTLDGWSFPKKVAIDNFYNRSPYFDYTISPTQNEMILAIQRDDALGDQDLYVSFYNDARKSWSEPLNLGAQINTHLAETAPYLAADGKTLYFASDGYIGYGGFDLYVTRRLDDTWTNWSTPENLGMVINGENNDLYYSVSAAADYAYFVSENQESRDVYRVPLPRIYKPQPVVLASGKVLHAQTGAPVAATINLYDGTDVISTSRIDSLTGEYTLIVPAGGAFRYTVDAPGFDQHSGVFNTETVRKYDERKTDINLYPSGATPAGTVTDQTTVLKSTRPALAQTPLLLKGKIIDGRTLKPIATRIAVKQDNAVVSRSASDPAQGQYQVMINGNTDLVISFVEEAGKEHTLPLKIDATTSTTESQKSWLLNTTGDSTVRVEIGSGFSLNMNAADAKRWNKTLRKKRSTRELLALKSTDAPLPQRLQDDLDHLATVALALPTYTLGIFTHTAKPADQQALQQAWANRVTTYLTSQGISKDRIRIVYLDDKTPVLPKPTHHRNNRIEAQLWPSAATDISSH